jgi:hypothetical protein
VHAASSVLHAPHFVAVRPHLAYLLPFVVPVRGRLLPRDGVAVGLPRRLPPPPFCAGASTSSSTRRPASSPSCARTSTSSSTRRSASSPFLRSRVDDLQHEAVRLLPLPALTRRARDGRRARGGPVPPPRRPSRGGQIQSRGSRPSRGGRISDLAVGGGGSSSVPPCFSPDGGAGW